MPAKILEATKDARGYHFLVHLDTRAIVDADECHALQCDEGDPHPSFLRRFDFGHLTPGVHQQNGKDMTEKQYLASMEAMIGEQVALELACLRPAEPVLVDALHGKEL